MSHKVVVTNPPHAPSFRQVVLPSFLSSVSQSVRSLPSPPSPITIQHYTNAADFTIPYRDGVYILVDETYFDEGMEEYNSRQNDGQQEEPEEKPVEYFGHPLPVLRVVRRLGVLPVCDVIGRRCR